ncbi:ATP-binding protein [Flavobacterium enshiense]|uniref:tetratricopeptide repeat-containing sensor histidine kinase n=1 Tax=Flavobacterium enshiense TaxID=1341165 RepID=UPI00345C7140
MIYECYLALGLSLRGMNNNQGAIEYYNKALKQTEKLKNDKQYKLLRAQPFNYIAIALQKEGDFSKAYLNSKKALSIDQFKDYDPTFYCYLINTYSYSKFILGDETCLKDFYETLKLGDSLANIHIQLNSKINLSEYFLKKNDSSKAEIYSKDVLTLSSNNKIFEDKLKALELLAKIDPKNSQTYNQRYITLNDSLQNVERATRNKFARIEFETDEITNEKKVVEAENERISMQLLVILVFSLFLLLALVLLVMVSKQRARNKELQLIQQQQQANAEIYQLMLDQQQKIEEGKQMEKQRISKELHDGVMGKLTAVRLNLFVLSKKNDPETIARCLEHVNEIQNIEKEIRKISHDLSHNVFAEQSDFMLMVTNLVENIKEHSPINFRIATDETIDWNVLGSLVKMQVYRILQESLQNVEKYAHAHNVSITMFKNNDTIEVAITDDGVGFNVEANKPGIGHRNMKERAAEIRSNLEITSQKGNGTKIMLKIPT